ncbi:MAG: InlB B-repeat-containing protein [Lachnospiraceae bacterium]|nr:InlB B-repeat-containing protein [Lachnospiraceae bacterium]
MKHRKGIVVLLLCAILALGMCAAMSHVSKAEDESTDESKEEFIYDMANADRRFVIDSSTGEGKQLVITGSSSSYGLHIRANKGENITIIFRDLSIDMSNVGIDMDKSAVFVVGEGDVTIKLEGKNSIIAGPGRPGINKVKGGEGYNSASIEGWLTITADDDSNELVVKGGSNGAAIGGYLENTGSKIRIAGGTVTAIGGGGAAGIGGGHRPSYRKASNGENIVITGGIVTAIGSDGSAGIGGGYFGQGSNITITGGIVTAIGGDGAAGIGSGAMGNCENITIAGGTVYAVGGDGGAGIGGGQYNRQQDSADELGKVSGIIITGTADVHAAGGIRELSQSMVAKAAAIGYGVQEVSSDACSDGDEIEICTTGEVDGKTLKLTGNVSKYEYGTTDKQILSGEAEKIEYVLEFDSNGGEGSMESKHGTTGLPIPLPENAFVRKGYVFLGWSYSSEPDSEIISTDEIVILKNSVTVTLYAVWKCVLVKTEAVEPTCTADGCKEYWSCDTCEEKFLDAAGKTVATEEDLVIPATGHTWKPATADSPKICEVCGAAEGEPVRYLFQGDSPIKWKSGDIVLTFKSNQEEDLSFENYRETSIDGVVITADVKRGSTIVTISEATLRELAAGEHTLKVAFSDGASEVKLDIEKTPEETVETIRMESPKTGDGLPAMPLAVAAAIAAAGFVLLVVLPVIVRKKYNGDMF